jgi:hypothetical protein
MSRELAQGRSALAPSVQQSERVRRVGWLSTGDDAE